MTIELKDIADEIARAESSGEVSGQDVVEVKALIAEMKTGAAESLAAQELALTKDDDNSIDVRTLIGTMELPGRLKFALFGNATCRSILIRDSNKLVQQFVMKNPKITIKEIEEFSRNQHLSDFVLRTIADSKMWMKSSLVKYNIVTNPKAPQDVALKWLRYLQSHELKRIAKSKNIPQVIAGGAKRLIED